MRDNALQLGHTALAADLLPVQVLETNSTDSGLFTSLDCTNPRNGKRFILPTLITGACTDETVLDYLRPENYNCK